jgi:AraC-like DNA-binding protein
MQLTASRAESLINRIQWEADGGVRLDLLGFVRFPSEFRGVRHSHTFWELIFIGSGSGTIEIGTSVHACEDGDILLVRPGEMHRFQSSIGKPFDQLYIGFSFDFAMPDTLSDAPPRALPASAFTDLIRSELRENLANLRERDPAHPSEAIRGRLLAVVSRVIGHLASPEVHSTSPYRERYGSPVRLAREILHADPKGDKGVPDLARRFCLSPRYFGEIFKRDTGLSVKEYQRNCRLDKARELLRSGVLSVTEVAAEVGWEDLAYFSRLFKKRYGVSPRQARTLPEL